ncbi:MAG: DUF3795 domain-containing protein [Dehalococcoidales bacterium]|jgi:hypothetical protein
MNDKMKLAAACGLYCGDCEILGEKCDGCNTVKGKPFWTAQYGVDVCPVYGCCADKKHLEHCGLCPELPCPTMTSMRDPSQSAEEAEKSFQQKQKDLKLRKEIGTAAWLKQR